MYSDSFGTIESRNAAAVACRARCMSMEGTRDPERWVKF
jgi:hypothetical protein